MFANATARYPWVRGWTSALARRKDVFYILINVCAVDVESGNVFASPIVLAQRRSNLFPNVKNKIVINFGPNISTVKGKHVSGNTTIQGATVIGPRVTLYIQYLHSRTLDWQARVTKVLAEVISNSAPTEMNPYSSDDFLDSLVWAAREAESVLNGAC